MTTLERPNTRTHNKIRQLRENPLWKTKAIVVVEGPSDKKLFKPLLPKCYLEYIHQYDDELSENSKDDVIELVRIFSLDAKIDGILGIVDADFDHYFKSTLPNDNLYYTDTHDSETMILSSDFFVDFMLLHININEVKSKGFNDFLEIRDRIAESSELIGFCLKYSIEYDIYLKFGNLSFSFLFESGPLQKLNIDLLISEINMQYARKWKGHEFKQAYSEYQKEPFTIRSNNKWQICRGHDYCKILFLALNSFRSCTKQYPNYKSLEYALREKYSANPMYFKKSRLYTELVEWESRKSKQGFHIF